MLKTCSRAVQASRPSQPPLRIFERSACLLSSVHLLPAPFHNETHRDILLPAKTERQGEPRFASKEWVEQLVAVNKTYPMQVSLHRCRHEHAFACTVCYVPAVARNERTE